MGLGLGIFAEVVTRVSSWVEFSDRTVAMESRLKGGCGHDWPPHTASSTSLGLRIPRVHDSARFVSCRWFGEAETRASALVGLGFGIFAAVVTVSEGVSQPQGENSHVPMARPSARSVSGG